MTLPDVLNALRGYRYLAANEAEIQDQIAEVLNREGVAFAREVPLADAGRIDFLLTAFAVGLEVKVAGGAAAVLRQLYGYAGAPTIQSLVLVTSRAALRSLRGPIAGKPLQVIHIGGGLL